MKCIELIYTYLVLLRVVLNAAIRNKKTNYIGYIFFPRLGINQIISSTKKKYKEKQIYGYLLSFSICVKLVKCINIYLENIFRQIINSVAILNVGIIQFFIRLYI